MTPNVKERIQQIQHGIVPDGYKKVKTGIIPKDWKYEVLAPYLIQHREVSEYSDQYPVLTSSRKGIFLQSDYYSKEIASEDNTGYNVVPRGYFTYRHMSDDEIFRFNINNIVDKGIVSTLYPVFTTKGINDYFLQAVLNEGREFRRFAMLQKQGGSRTYMYFDKLKQLRVCLPPRAEQEKIAEILRVQDRIIELNRRKIEELEKLKKVFLYKMFPQKTENVPEWRFPRFIGPWEKRKFGAMFKRRTERNNGQFDNTRWISVAKMYFQDPEKVSSNNIDTRTYVMRRGDIAFEGHPNSEYKYGRFVANDIGDGVISELFPIYKHTDKYDESYWKYAIQIESIMAPKLLRCIEISYTSSNKLDEDFFLKEEISVPSLVEQQQIGAFFRKLDNLISSYHCRLIEEKLKKKALMQLLLTGMVRV